MVCAPERDRAALLALSLMLAAPLALGAASRGSPIEIHRVRVDAGQSGPVLEITASGPLAPKLQTVEQPLRLVIDLPAALLTGVQRKISYHDEQISGIRLNQYQSSPPVTRIVVDLTKPVHYSWEKTGNHVYVRMTAEESGTKPPSVPAFTTGVQPAIVPVTVGNTGTLVEAGNRVASGSSITAGEQTALLRLARGGEVKVCPGTTISVTTSPNGQDLMLGMSQGSIETHYVLTGSVDSVVTPDFRIVLPGPGAFNVAVRADNRGNTCVGSLRGSTSSAVVAELLGSGTYEIKPEQQIVFRQGRLDATEIPVMSCGCPAPEQPVLAASARSPVSDDPAEGRLQLQNSGQSTGSGDSPGLSAASPEGQKTAPNDKQPAQAEAQLEAPLVFIGRERTASHATILAAPVPEVTGLPIAARRSEPLPAMLVLPPRPDPPGTRENFFRKVKGFFGSLIR
ncbi:MAG: AMIN domain-containing protein [Acidobacteria bacterium]|nr:AMIN domain-containing protein [Acidobacteriota bacterium]